MTRMAMRRRDDVPVGREGVHLEHLVLECSH